MDPTQKPNAPPSLVGLFSSDNPIAELNTLIQAALTQNASRLLLLAGKPVVCRINGQLSEPLIPGRLHFTQTQNLANALLTQEQLATLDTEGSVEITYAHQPGNHATESDDASSPVHTNITIFFGDGAHNLVIHLDYPPAT